VEIGIGRMVHEREAWDSSYYWLFGLPAMIVGAFLGGFFARRKPVLIGYKAAHLRRDRGAPGTH
jgi:hypothetical protein